MRSSQVLSGISLGLLSAAEARIVTPHDPSTEVGLARRALPANAPHGYTPQPNNCPSDAPSIRTAGELSPQEQDWLDKRRNATVDPLKSLLGRLNITGLDTQQYISNHAHNASALPNIGIAVSGGGYRAMLNGAGVIEAFDDRTTNSTGQGQLGGLLQSATYVSGLSGGSWLVTSLYTNNFTSVDAIIAQDDASSNSGDIWQLGNSIFQGPKTGGIQLLGSVGYYAALENAVSGKSDAGFNVTITDYWGRALSYQLFNATDGGPAYTFSSIAQQDWFTSGSVPLPLVVADSRAPGATIVSSNSTIFVFNPWELGSSDPDLFGYAPLKYIGTNFTGGSPTTNKCVTGYDNVGFVTGTSSSLFNAVLTVVNGANTTGLLGSALQNGISAVLGTIGANNIDIADWVNPFYHWRNDTNPYALSERLTLVDGGEDGQNIPLYPLIQPDRHVDVIFAVDSSADTNSSFPTSSSAANWPDGTSLVATYERSLNKSIENGTAFPAIPDTNTFLNLGLNNRPTFFGCNANNQSGPSPLIVYLPNAPYVYNGNVSTFDLQYNDTVRNALVLNGYNGATQGNGSLDTQWPTCVGCAILQRSLLRTNTNIPAVCNSCFNRYCWNGTTDSRAPGDYVPKMKLSEVKVTTSGARRLGFSMSAALVAVVAAGLALA